MWAHLQSSTRKAEVGDPWSKLESVRIGELQVQVRAPTSIDKAECDRGRLSVSASGRHTHDYTYTHTMYIHTWEHRERGRQRHRDRERYRERHTERDGGRKQKPEF